LGFVPYASSPESKANSAELLHWRAVLNGLPPPQSDMNKDGACAEDALDVADAKRIDAESDGASPNYELSNRNKDRVVAEYSNGSGLFSLPYADAVADEPEQGLEAIGPAADKQRPVLLRDLGSATYSDLVFNPTQRPKTITALVHGKGSVALEVHRRWVGAGFYAPDGDDLAAFGVDGMGTGALLSDSDSNDTDAAAESDD